MNIDNHLGNTNGVSLNLVMHDDLYLIHDVSVNSKLLFFDQSSKIKELLFELMEPGTKYTGKIVFPCNLLFAEFKWIQIRTY